MAAAADLPRQPDRSADAVLDACVLVPASLRGTLLNAAAAGAFVPAWSEPILGEVRGTLIGKRMIGPRQWDRLDGALRREFPAALVPETQIRALEPSMRNDPKDRHVLAAAVASGSPVVVTNNLKDFRATDLNQVGVQAMHPDRYLCHLLERSPNAVAKAIEGQVEDMSAHGRWSAGQLLGHLKGLGRGQAMAPRFAERAEAKLGIRAVAPPPPQRLAPGRTAVRSRDSASLGR